MHQAQAGWETEIHVVVELRWSGALLSVVLIEKSFCKGGESLDNWPL